MCRAIGSELTEATISSEIVSGVTYGRASKYPAGLYNNRQIQSQQDVVSGETVSLKRLSSASSTAGRGRAFGYDGFDIMTSRTALAGSPPVGVYTTGLATNRPTGEVSMPTAIRRATTAAA